MARGEFDDLPNLYRAPYSKLDAPPRGVSSTTRGINLAVDNPWLTIWTRPRATIRGIVDHDPTYRVVPLAMATGVLWAVNQMGRQNAGDATPLAGILGFAAIVGPLAGIIQIYIAGWWFSNMGRIFGGHAQSKEVRTAVAWASVPSFATIPFLAVAIALFGNRVFTKFVPGSSSPLLATTLLGVISIQIIFGTWSGVVFLKGLGEVHGFSAWRALACTIVPGLLFVLILGIIIGVAMVGLR
jgi:hypothetical protein